MEINKFLRGFSPPPGSWTGGISPHAGWAFSGKASARVLNTISGSTKPDRVVIFGGHLSEGNAPIVYTEDSWETPLGPVTLDQSTCSYLIAEGIAVAAHRTFSDNTVEIQLPMVKRFFPETPVIAIHSPSSDTARALGSTVESYMQAQGLTAVYIGSADLTHYGPNYGFIPRGKGPDALRWVKEENDRILIDQALAMDAEGLLRESRFRHNTCSAGPIASVIASESLRGVKEGFLIEYYTSYDVMPGSSFVGYAGIVY